MGHFPPCISVHMRLCVYPLSVEFLFPEVLWKSYYLTPPAFKARFSGDSSHCWIPRLGSQTWGSALSLLWDNFSGTIVFQLVGSPPMGGKKLLEPTKNDTLHLKKINKPQHDGRTGTITIKSNPIPIGGLPTSWKTIVPEKLSHPMVI